MRRFLILLLLTLVPGTIGCAPGEPPPEIVRRARPTDAPIEAPPAIEKGGSMPAPALVLIGLAIGAALMVALVSNTTVMPDTAP